MTRRALLPVVAILVALLVPAAPPRASGAAPATDAPVEVPATAWYLVSEEGEVLAERNATERRAIASITKLMTAIVTLEHARLSEIVTVAPRSARVGESSAFLRTGEQLPVSTLLRAMLVASANDAADALAVHVGRGSLDRFVGLMNAKARALGLDETTFANAHGLDEPGHISSAEDATALVRHALGVPFIRDALDRSSVELPSGRELPTTDDLLESWPPLIGGKTGHTADAGWSQAAAARARGVTVYATVLGSASRSARNEALVRLLSYGLGQYQRVATITKSRVYAESETGYDEPAVELVALRPIVRTVRKGKALVERVIAPGVVELPVRRGQRLGRVEIYDGRRLIASSQLVAAESVSAPSRLEKSAWYAKRTAANLWGFVT